MVSTFKDVAPSKWYRFTAPEPNRIAETLGASMNVALPNATPPSPTAEYELCGRPWLVLAYWRYRRPMSPSAMVHEYTHILQREDGLRLTDSEQRQPHSASAREASACLAGAQVVEGMIRSGYPCSRREDTFQHKVGKVIMDHTQGDLSHGLPQIVLDEMQRLACA